MILSQFRSISQSLVKSLQFLLAPHQPVVKIKMCLTHDSTFLEQFSGVTVCTPSVFRLSCASPATPKTERQKGWGPFGPAISIVSSFFLKSREKTHVQYDLILSTGMSD